MTAVTEQSLSGQSLQASRDDCRQWLSPSAYGEVHSVTEQSLRGQGLQADGDGCRQRFSPSAYGESPLGDRTITKWTVYRLMVMSAGSSLVPQRMEKSTKKSPMSKATCMWWELPASE